MEGAPVSTLDRRVSAPLFLVPLVLAVACAKPIPVGVILSETGAAAPYGEKVRRGVELALAQLHAAGGPGARIRLLYRDDATNPDVGAQVARELIDKEGARILIGAVSSPVTLKIAPICEARRTVLLSPTSSAPAITRAGDFIFRNYPSDMLEGASMADFARDAGLRRFVVLAVDDEFGAGLSRVFTARFEGGNRRVVRHATFTDGDAVAFRRLAAELRVLRPDGVYVVAYGDDTAALFREIRAAGVASVVLGTSSVTESAVRLAGPAADDLVFPEPAFDPASNEPATRTFVAAYRARFQAEPDAFAAHGYDALRLVATALERAGSAGPEAVRRSLASIDDFPGATGPIAFDENGDVVQYPRLFIVKRGEPEPYDRFVERGGTLTGASRD